MGAIVSAYWFLELLGAVLPATSTDRLLRYCHETFVVFACSRLLSRAVKGGAIPDNLL